MKRRTALPVGHLKSYAFGHRDPLWWGLLLLMAIEGTVFVLTVASYLYVRGNFHEWPPVAIPPATRASALVTLGLLALSLIPTKLLSNACEREDLKRMQLWLVVLTVACVACGVARVAELYALNFRWDDHVYGSLFWLAIGMHTLHILFGTLEDLALLLVLFRGPVEHKHLVDAATNAFYWYFVPITWFFLFAVLYLDPGLFGR